jgi:hypothetical protein
LPYDLVVTGFELALKREVLPGQWTFLSNVLQKLELDLHFHIREFGYVDGHDRPLLALSGISYAGVSLTDRDRGRPTSLLPLVNPFCPTI